MCVIPFQDQVLQEHSMNILFALNDNVNQCKGTNSKTKAFTQALNNNVIFAWHLFHTKQSGCECLVGKGKILPPSLLFLK